MVYSYGGVVGEFSTNLWRGRVVWVSKRSLRSRASSSILNVGRKCRGGSEGTISTTWGRRNACEMRRAKHNLNARYRPNRPTKGFRRRFDNQTRSQNYRNCRSTGSSTWPLPVALKGADTKLYVSQAHVAYASYRLYRETFRRWNIDRVQK